jgi:cell division protein FtsB
MNNVATTQPAKGPRPRISLRTLQAELKRLRQRVEDLEDLRDLNEAIARNKGKPLIPWEEAKNDLGIAG